MNDIVNDQPSTGQAEGAQSAEAQPQITSLDSLSEFEFQGEKLTPSRLQEVFQGYKTLNEKVRQSQSEERYWSNLDADIENVIADPSKAEQFKSIYPEKFHRILDRALGQTQKQSTNTPAIPKEFMQKLSKIDQIEQHFQQMQVEAANAKLEVLLPKLAEKYPLSNEDQVLAKAEAMLSQGMRLTDQAWERLAKESHEAGQKKYDAYNKAQFQKQQDKSLLGKDAPAGGMAPGKAPQKFKNFAEAEAGMIQHLKSQGWT